MDIENSSKSKVDKNFIKQSDCFKKKIYFIGCVTEPYLE